MPRPPNILFLMADQFRADALGLVNGWVRTPNLDRLARQGGWFQNGYTNAPVCVPARISLATGLYPHQTGIDYNQDCQVDPGFPTWTQALQRGGYRTSVFGKTHLHPHRGDLRDRLDVMRAYGFETVDEICGPRASVEVRSGMTDMWEAHGLWSPYREDVRDRFASRPWVARPSPLGGDFHYDVYVGRKAATYLADVQADRPWFCWVSFAGPHEPWDAPEPYASLYNNAPIPKATPAMADAGRARGLSQRKFGDAAYNPDFREGEVRALRANYAGNVTLIDDQIGRLMDILTRRGMLSDTLVVFTSDHGEMNGDQGLIYKEVFFDPVVRTPIIVAPPGGLGRALTGLVELMDVGATILDYAGLQAIESSRARSLRPLVEGAATHLRDFAISEMLGHTAIIEDRWKAEIGPDMEVATLFDRLADPHEQVNLVGRTGSAAVVQRMQNQLTQFQRTTLPPDRKVVDVG